MSKKKATKRALLTSALAMIMCVAMLIGTTFAWFTDTASTAVNKIQAGTLDVALEMYDGANWITAEGKTLNFKTADGRTTNILWEPGCTYELPALRVVNKGNLALKYKVAITGINGDATLNEVIDWTINDAPINLVEKHLAAETADSEFVIKGHMQETAGNEYQGLAIDGISITVYATQLNSENDSFGPDYDADAEYMKNSATLLDGTNGKTILLEAGKTYTIGNGTIEVEDNGDIIYTNTGAAQTVIITTDGGTLTVNAPNDTVYHYGAAYIVNIQEVASASYHEYGEIISFIEVEKGRVVLEKGSKVDVVKVSDSALAGNVTITNNSDVSVRSFALDGVLTSENVNGTGNVAIIPTDADNKFITVSSYSELATALSKVVSGEYVDPVIYCPGGVYQFENYIFSNLSNKSVTILGDGPENTEFLGFGLNASVSGQMGLGLFFKLYNNASVDIRGIKFKDFARYDYDGNPIVGNYDNYGQGIYVSGSSDNNVTTNVKACAFEGLGGRSFISVGAGSTTMEDCYFDATDRHFSTINGIEIFGGKTVEVTNCYFKSVVNMDEDWPSTAIAIFDTTGKWDADSTVEISGCTFDTCDDYCINHELVYGARAPIPVVKNITYVNCDDVIAHIYLSYMDEVLPDAEGYDYNDTVNGKNCYGYFTTDENGVKYEKRYYYSGAVITNG